MGFREQLSLAKNGGVYYEGTRVDATEDPVLFVGLGGTGIDGLLRIKNEIQTRMHLPKDEQGQVLATAPTNIAFLAMDTDRSVTKKTYGVAGFERTGDDFIDLSVDGLPQVIKGIVDKRLGDEEWSWYDKELSANGGIDGANGKRQIGRFMFFQNITDICDKFTKTIERVLNATQSNNLRIFVLTGIGGGTGSGTFLDTAYILRHLARRKTPNVQMHGYVFTPDLNKGNGGDENSMYRNGFASLKELDYWMSASEHGNPFIQKYNSSITVNSEDRPFDFCHIITAQDADHRLVSYSDAMDAVGGNLFAYIVSETTASDGNSALKSMYDNISGHIDAAEKSHAANYRFLSIGSDKLEIPYTEITTLIAARVFAKLAPVFENAPTQDKFNANLFGLQLTANQLWDYIHRNVVGNPIKEFAYKEIWPGNGPYRMAEQWIIKAEQVMKQNSSNMASVYEGLFRPYVDGLMKDVECGPCYAARLVYSNTSWCLIKTLEGFKKDCADRRSACAQRANEGKNKLQQAFVGGEKAGIFGHGNAAREYNEALEYWFNNRYGWAAYDELINGLDELIERLQKYYDKVFKNLQDSLCELPIIFKENLDRILSDEKAAMANPERVKHYLIRPMEFEAKYKETLAKKVDESAVAFLRDVAGNLRQWVGLKLDDVDVDIMASTDIAGCIARFIDENFGMTLAMNMEQLLLDRAPNGVNTADFLRETLDNLKAAAVPMYHMDVDTTDLDVKAFSIISIPDNCHETRQIANRPDRPTEDAPKASSERSKMQWVKVMAGLPLYIYPEVIEMEKAYEKAMAGGPEQRKGVHLRWEWREQLPSPLPEETWAKEIVGEPQKEFSKMQNRRVRDAFDTCVAAGIIRPTATGEDAMLYIADEAQLTGLELHGSLQEKRAKLEMLRKTLWGNEGTALRLKPFGKADGKDLMVRVRENNLRFFNIAEILKKQAEVLAKFEAMTAKFDNVSYFINAIFADLIYKQGFDIKFRRSALDVAPVKLFDAMSQTDYPAFETYKAFGAILTEEIKGNVTEQFTIARSKLIGADGNFIAESVAAKTQLLAETKAGYEGAVAKLVVRIEQTPLDQRGELNEMRDFYEMAIETIDNTLRVFNA